MTIKCEHKNIRFEGMFSMIGSYVCQDCKLKIEPFVLHALRDEFHTLFLPRNKDHLTEAVKGLDSENLQLWHTIPDEKYNLSNS